MSINSTYTFHSSRQNVDVVYQKCTFQKRLNRDIHAALNQKPLESLWRSPLNMSFLMYVSLFHSFHTQFSSALNQHILDVIFLKDFVPLWIFK